MEMWEVGQRVRSKFNPSFTGVIEQINAKGTRIIKTNWWCSRYEFGTVARLEQYWVRD